ncbi:MAG: hypothetical protein IJ678_06140 [Kiritimatiellae bacterium]|nr:hypothetical protein [Kiritimatiellia bacterium]
MKTDHSMMHSTCFESKRGSSPSARFAAVAAVLALSSAATAAAAVTSSVFDDVKVWYRGALAAESYYSNGPEGAFANNGGKTGTAFKSIPHSSDPGNALNALKWSWGWGAETTLDDAPVVCPYAGCTLTGVTYANRPVPAKTNDWADVTVNGVTTSQPVLSHWKGPEYLLSGNWISGSAGAYTLVLRLRVDTPLNNVTGSADTGGGFSIFAESLNYSWASNAGNGLRVTFVGDTLGTYRYPRIFFGGVYYNLLNAKVPFGNWIDIAISVDGSSVVVAACAQGENGNSLDWQTATLASGVKPALPASGDTFRLLGPNCSGGYTAVWTNGLATPSYNSAEHGMRTQHFRGAVHQIAFWDRALSADEIRSAWGEGRPNLVQVGMEGNAAAEFSSASEDNAVANGGAWQLLDPALTAEKPAAAISFDCPALWAGLPQWLRIAGAGSGAVSVALNGETLGEAKVPASGAASFFVPEGKIASGANTLVLTRLSGTPVLDAVRLGGSWRFGESVTSFNDTAVDANTASKVGADCWIFHPACGNDKFHARGTTWSIGGDMLSFPVFVPADMVGKYRGDLSFKSATASTTAKFRWGVNGASMDEITAGPNAEYATRLPETLFAPGWNSVAWNRTNSWINFNSFQFKILPAPAPFVIVVR